MTRLRLCPLQEGEAAGGEEGWAASMSKVIKQMEMDALKAMFQGVTDMVVFSPTGVNAQLDHGLRNTLRKKNIRLVMVKNTLARRVFKEIGINVPDDSPYWQKSTWMAWSTESADELKKIKAVTTDDPRFKDKLTIKGAITEKKAIAFEIFEKLPTRAEALARVAALILGPGGQLASAIMGPGGQIAAQVKTIGEGEKGEGEKKEEPAPAPAT